MNREQTRALIARIIGEELAKMIGGEIGPQRELLSRAAVLGLEQDARDMLAAGKGAQEVAEFLLEEAARRRSTGGNPGNGQYQSVDEIPDDVFARALTRPVLFSSSCFDDDVPGARSRSHDRTGGAGLKLEDISDADFARALTGGYRFR